MRNGVLVSLFTLLWIPFSGTATSLPVPPRVSLEIGGPLSLTYSFSVGGAPLFQRVNVQAVGIADIYNTVDVYVGAHRPDGRFASWVAEGAAEPVLTVNSLPQPLMKNISIQTVVIPSPLQHEFSDGDPPGFYIAYAILVFPGTDPLDTINWIDISTVPFKLSPALAIPQTTR